MGPGHNRGGFSGGGRGRGGYNPQYNNQAGFPPNVNRPYNGPNAGRGGMNNYRGGGYSSPRASPATQAAIPHHGNTPTMAQATLAPNTPYYPQQMYTPHQQVKSPFVSNESFSFKSSKKNKGMRRDSDKYHPRPPNPSQKQSGNEFGHKPRRQSKRWDLGPESHQVGNGSGPPQSEHFDGPLRYEFAPLRHVSLFPPPFMGPTGPINLSPESGEFEKLVLTGKQKQMPASYNMGGQPMPYGQPMQMMPAYPNQPYPQQYMPPAQQFTPNSQPFVPGAVTAQYVPAQPAAQAMSRNPSQVSDRPASSTGQNQAPVVAQGTPQQRPAQMAPAIVSSSNFTRPKQSTKIVIKDAQGNLVDLKNQVKTPSSPSPSIQQSKTPPVIATTPTPPPNLSKGPLAAHGRSESKTAEQIRNEFIAKVRGSSSDKGKEDEEAKAAAEKEAADKKAAEEAKAKEEAETKAKAEKEAAEKKVKEEAEAKAKAEAEAKEKAEKEAAEKKAAEEAKAKEEAEAKAKADADAEAAKPKENSADPDEDEMERIIREMEEEDARREKEQAEITARKNAEKEAAKKKAEAEKALSAAENDRKLREQEREMERLEEEKERKRQEGAHAVSVADLLAKKIDDLKLSDKPEPTPAADEGSGAKSAAEKRNKPAALNLAPLKTNAVEAPQPSAALQSLRSARLLSRVEYNIYPEGIQSPNPALNSAVSKKGKVFKYDTGFLLQFKSAFTEQPSPEFHQQVKSLIGDSDGSRSASARTPGAGRAASRGAGMTGGFPSVGGMGGFRAEPTLPPGTTSEQRFAAASRMSSMGSFGPRGAFPGQISRNPSTAGGIPNSPRTGSRRGGSKREGGGNPKAEAQAAKTMPLTAGMELKPIAVTASGWKPTSIGNKAAQAAVPQVGHMDPEMVQRKVKAALNKMTPEKFDKISDQILLIAGQSKNEQDGRTLRQVIQLTFEKATDEAHWASMYAKFCKRMLEMMSPEIRDENILDKQGNVVSGGALFRKYLLNRCQEEFERGWKVDLPENPDNAEKKPGEAALLSDEYYIAAAAKRRGLGLVQFIGELYKLGMLTERIMHECVRKLLEFDGVPDEAEIESLTKLLKTIGANLDSTEKGRPMMEVYFHRIKTTIELPNLPSRLKFMLMDIVDLRKAQWQSKEANKGPKTLEEVRAEVSRLPSQKSLM